MVKSYSSPQKNNSDVLIAMFCLQTSIYTLSILK